jgi:WD40 repeat protein
VSRYVPRWPSVISRFAIGLGMAVAVAAGIAAPGTPPAQAAAGALRVTPAGVFSDPGSEVNNGVTSVAFGPGGILAIPAAHGIDLWDTSTGKVAATLAGPCGHGPGPMASGPGGLLAADCGNAISLWDTATGKLTGTLTDPPSAVGNVVTSVAFGPGGVLAVSDADGTIFLWDSATRRLEATIARPAGDEAVTLSPGEDVIAAIAFSRGGLLASGNIDGTTYLYHVGD